MVQLAGAERPDFMIHCGDQIHADIPTMPLFPDVQYYRDRYREAWKLEPTSTLLRSLANYMILDDHEIFDGYANDAEFVGRNSLPALYYALDFAGAQFFVMDVRSERYRRNGSQMISALQLARFKDWLGRHANRPKFVVSSIPFVSDVRDQGDKWCGDPFRAQREEIVDFVAQNGIGGLVFLTGDMHCSYHVLPRHGPARSEISHGPAPEPVR